MLPLFFLFSLLAATARCKSILKLLLNIYLFDIPTRRLTGSPRYAHPAFSISSQLCSCCLPSQPRSQHSFIYLSRSLAVFEPSIAWLFLSLGLFTTLYILQIIRLSPSIPATIIAYQVPAVITYLYPNQLYIDLFHKTYNLYERRLRLRIPRRDAIWQRVH